MFYRELHLLINSIGLVALRAKMSNCRTDRYTTVVWFLFFRAGSALTRVSYIYNKTLETKNISL